MANTETAILAGGCFWGMMMNSESVPQDHCAGAQLFNQRVQ